MESRRPAKTKSATETPLASLLPVARNSSAQVEDCWNKIGVLGDGSCAELAKVAHCRNCPVYSASGALLLDRELPQNYRREWSEHFAREKQKATLGKNSVVVFRIGSEWLALPTVAFQEIAERRPIHSLPQGRRTVVLGLINVRGELLLCVSLARLLGIQTADADGKPPKMYNRLVVAEWHGGVLTFPVDEIHGIQRYHPEELKPPPATLARATTFATGLLSWENRMVGCLNAEMVFSTLNRSLAA